jgi:hypothetical protein
MILLEEVPAKKRVTKKDLLHACEEALHVLDGRVGDLLTGDLLAESGAYDVINILEKIIKRS